MIVNTKDGFIYSNVEIAECDLSCNRNLFCIKESNGDIIAIPYSNINYIKYGSKGL